MPIPKLYIKQIKCLTFFTIIFLPINVFAEETVPTVIPELQKFYDVELIVFRNKSVPKGSERNFPSPSPARTEKTLDFSNPAGIQSASEIGFTVLPQNDLRLLDIVQQIIRSSRYELLTHIGWRQPGLDEVSSLPVWIKGGKIYSNGYSSIDQSDVLNEQKIQLIPENSEQMILSPQPAKDQFYELEGQITIKLSRYLHTQANLVLRLPADIQELSERIEQQPSNDPIIETTEGKVLFNYGLNEQRRMRSKKLHYLDHPQFGLLVLLTPYEKPIEEPVIEAPILDLVAEPAKDGKTPIAQDNKPALSN